MAANKLQWIFEVIDRVSAPGRSMARVMGTLATVMGTGISRSVRLATTALASMRRVLFETTGLLRNVFDFTKGLTSRVFDFGKALVKNAAFQENAKLSLEFFLGSAKEAEETFEALQRVAFAAKQPVDEFVKTALPLAKGGFSGQEIAVLAQSLGDLAVVNPEGVSQFADIMARIKSTGLFSSRDIRGLADAGIRGTIVFEELSKTFGLSAKSLNEFEEQLEKGGIGRLDPAGVIAALQSAAARSVGGIAGTALKRGAGTIQGDINALGNTVDQLFDRIQGGKGFKAFRSAFTNLVTSLSPGGALSKGLEDLLNGPVARFLTQFSGPEGLQKIADIFKDIKETITGITDAIKTVSSALSAFSELVSPGKEGSAGGGVRSLFKLPAIFGRGQGATPTSSLPKDKTTGAVIEINVNAPNGGNAQEIGDKTASALASVLRNMGFEQGAA